MTQPSEKPRRRGFTKIELILVLVVVGTLLIVPWVIWHLFHQTTILGAVKWGCLLISMSVGASKSGGK